MNDGQQDGMRAFLQRVKDGTEEVALCPDFAKGLPWINTSEPLSIYGNLHGKVVVLDFWTYCCINCLHILPDLHDLEKLFSDRVGLAVIGVHSAKFPNEKVSANIQNAVDRYGITHPVINDSDAVMWNEMGIQCWPTIVVIGPDAKVLQTFIGEGHREELFSFVDCVLDVYKDVISHDPLPFHAGSVVEGRLLCYPGKVLYCDNLLIVSDTGNHRVLICSPTGSIQHIVGGRERGHKDGAFNEALFISPQGLCKVGDFVYVVDCDSHHLRQVDLTKQTVTTLAGTGRLGSDKVGGGVGVDQVLSSPWDVKPLASQSGGSYDMLLIAMAGTHQIWSYFLEDTTWWKSQQYKKSSCVAIVGSGKEENRNNSYPMKCGLAQPSGLAMDHFNSMCYIADSESSTVRQLHLANGQVKGMVGGERDPMNLFAYGDVDGKGVDAKLQHPLDVCAVSDKSNHFVIVCDSYNHKLKLVNVDSKVMTTLLVEGLSEPSGLSFDSVTRTLFIADTNNHRIMRVQLPDDLSDLKSPLQLSQVQINLDTVDSPRVTLFNHDSKSVIRLVRDELEYKSSSQLHLDLYTLPDKCHLTQEARSEWKATIKGAEGRLSVASGLVEDPENRGSIRVGISMSVPETAGSRLTLEVELLVYYCHDTDSVCKRSCVLLTQPLRIM